VPVSTLDGGDTLRERSPGFAPIRGGAGDRAKVNVAGGGQQVDMIGAAAGVGAPIEGMEIAMVSLI